MADTKTTDLAAFGSIDVANDLLFGVDASDTAMAASGTPKRLNPNQLTLTVSAGSGLSGGGSVALGGSVSLALSTPLAAANLTPAGSSGQLQYNSSSAFAGATRLAVGSSGQLNFGAISTPGSPGDGDTWNDSTQGCIAHRSKGLNAYKIGLIYSQSAKVTVSATGSSTLVSTTGAAGTVSLPANFFAAVGQTLRLRFGGYATSGSSPGNLYVFLKLGSSTVATTYTGAWTASRTNVPIWGTIDLVCKGTGVSGLLDSAGFLYGANAVGQAFPYMAFSNGTTAGTQAPTSQVSLDTTASYALDLQLNLSATGNSFTLSNLSVECCG